MMVTYTIIAYSTIGQRMSSSGSVNTLVDAQVQIDRTIKGWVDGEKIDLAAITTVIGIKGVKA
jgi:hypothetical protein